MVFLLSSIINVFVKTYIVIFTLSMIPVAE